MQAIRNKTLQEWVTSRSHTSSVRIQKESKNGNHNSTTPNHLLIGPRFIPIMRIYMSHSSPNHLIQLQCSQQSETMGLGLLPEKSLRSRFLLSKFITITKNSVGRVKTSQPEGCLFKTCKPIIQRSQISTTTHFLAWTYWTCIL